VIIRIGEWQNDPGNVGLPALYKDPVPDYSYMSMQVSKRDLMTSSKTKWVKRNTTVIAIVGTLVSIVIILGKA
jgi:hypothetical protein